VTTFLHQSTSCCHISEIQILIHETHLCDAANNRWQVASVNHRQTARAVKPPDVQRIWHFKNRSRSGGHRFSPLNAIINVKRHRFKLPRNLHHMKFTVADGSWCHQHGRSIVSLAKVD
jgi:hypothetical protein